jgi:hypothetical protein
MNKQPPAGQRRAPANRRDQRNRGGPFGTARKTPEPNFINLFKGLPLVPAPKSKSFPANRSIMSVANMGGPQSFLTSSQCLGCHSASPENMAFLFDDKISRR